MRRNKNSGEFADFACHGEYGQGVTGEDIKFCAAHALEPNLSVEASLILG